MTDHLAFFLSAAVKSIDRSIVRSAFLFQTHFCNKICKYENIKVTTTLLFFFAGRINRTSSGSLWTKKNLPSLSKTRFYRAKNAKKLQTWKNNFFLKIMWLYNKCANKNKVFIFYDCIVLNCLFKKKTERLFVCIREMILLNT
jgi:hypothetical protein